MYYDNVIPELWGVIRITNPQTLQRWKDLGKFQKLTDEGYIFAEGCKRFRKEVCNCCKCKQWT